ncbi:Thiamine kinase [Serratia symbiotica]|nr:Thiamine kinase [Serratia symbiotica]
MLNIYLNMKSFISFIFNKNNYKFIKNVTNHSFYINYKDINILIKKKTIDKNALGISFSREAKFLYRCGKNIGPKVLFYNNHWIIIEWIYGKEVTSKIFNSLNFSHKLALIISQLHQQPLSGYYFNFKKQLLIYWNLLDKKRLTPAWLNCQKYFLKISLPTPLKLAPLHMDIHPGNIIFSLNGLKLIDWEYAMDGDIALEIAILFRINNWTFKQCDYFLKYYTQYSYLNQFTLYNQIRNWLLWVDYLILMWFEVRWNQSGDIKYLYLSEPFHRSFCLL